MEQMYLRDPMLQMEIAAYLSRRHGYGRSNPQHGSLRCEKCRTTCEGLPWKEFHVISESLEKANEQT